jgi:hypothetical protein
MREVEANLWVEEEPLRFLGVQAGRRMVVVRLPGGDLWIHSPARHRPDLDQLGRPRYVVAASNLHGHLHMQHYADLELFSAPGLERKRKDLAFAGRLGDAPDPRWAETIDQVAFRGHRLLTEIVFLHKPSGTLIVGDLVWNVTPEMPLSARLWARTGVRPTPAFRLAIRDKAAARESLERILAWDFDRIAVGHGEMVETGGRGALRSAYAWLLS